MESRSPYGSFSKVFILLIFFGIIFPVAGQAFNNWPDTGQTTSYTDTFGEDSDYSANPQSYTKLDAAGNDLADDAASWTMVRDNVTGLIWEVKTDDESVHDKDNTYTWYDSNTATNGGNAGTPGNGTDTEDFIAALNATNYGGYSDWRMPTIKELSTITNSEAVQPSINVTYFPNTVLFDHYWSSTSHASLSYIAWKAYSNYGDVTTDGKSDRYCVRAVRGTNDNSTHFIDNGDGTILDISTGLMWQKATQPAKNWEAAIADCESLSLADYDDWRLPNRNELQSLIDYSIYSPAIDTSFFPDTQSSNYWSSTTYANNSDYAWDGHFFLGFMQGLHPGLAKLSSYYVRAVRGGTLAVDTIKAMPWIPILLLTENSSENEDDVKVDIESIAYSETNAVPAISIDHIFSSGNFQQAYNGGVNQWEDIAGQGTNIGLINGVWRMNTDPATSSEQSSLSAIGGNGYPTTVPTEFEFLGKFSNFENVDESGHTYDIVVGTGTSSDDNALECEVSVTWITGNILGSDYDHALFFEGWVGNENETYDGTTGSYFLTGYHDPTSTIIELKAAVSSDGQVFKAYYRLNEETTWHLIGQHIVPGASGKLYGWYNGGTIHMFPFVKIIDSIP